eukprot:Lithocolla_globosa_v1_NODE_111_length_6228_cov_60.322858.p1 type:complete len:1891 gc:universal NODE_111_length_6228_cov_60.322858:496-6168(+)
MLSSLNQGSYDWSTYTEVSDRNDCKLIAADVVGDNDGYDDFIEVNSFGRVRFWNNNGGTWTEVGDFNNDEIAYDMDVADMDGDGKLDYIYSEISNGFYIFYQNNALNNDWDSHRPDTSDDHKGLTAVDLDGDLKMDVLTTTSTKINWYRNTGTTGNHNSPSFTKTVLPFTLSGARLVRAIDLDLDGDQDIIVSQSTTMKWYDNNGAQSFTEYTAFTYSSQWVTFEVEDMNSNLFPDIVVSLKTAGQIDWYESPFSPCDAETSENAIWEQQTTGVRAGSCVAGYEGSPMRPCDRTGVWGTPTVSCTACPTGYYKSDTGAGPCLQCSVGLTTPSTGSTSINDCVCGTGYTLVMASCQACSSGTYKDTVGDEACTPCPDGSSTTQTGASDRDDCDSCLAGSSGGGPDGCEICEDGTYTDSLNTLLTCIDCPEGSTTIGNTFSSHDSINDCIQCLPGYSGSAPNCNLCQVGTYQPISGSSPTCSSCPGGSTTSAVDISSNRDQESDCGLCLEGYTGTGPTSCNLCQANSYKPTIGNDLCTPCDTGLATEGSQVTDRDDINDCNLCLAGYQPDMFSNGCLVCPVGTYSDSTDANNCTDCLGGTTTPLGADSAAEHDELLDCSACQPGYAGSGCLLCGEGTYDDGSVCQSCPFGSTTSGLLPQDHDQLSDCDTCIQDYAGTPPDCQPKCLTAYVQSGYTISGCPSDSEDGTQCDAVCDSGEGFTGMVSGNRSCDDGSWTGGTGFFGCSGSCDTVYQQEGYVITCTGSSNSDNCSAICDAGLFGISIGSVTCMDNMWMGAFTGCSVCDLGEYQPQTNQTSCLTCLVGSTTRFSSPMDHDEENDCFVCQDGYSGTGPSMCFQDCLGSYTQSNYLITSCDENTLSGTNCTSTCAIGSTGIVTGSVSCFNGGYVGDFQGCNLCDVGSFKALPGPDDCQLCPVGSNTSEPRERESHNQLSDCNLCATNFSGSPPNDCKKHCLVAYSQTGFDISNCGNGGVESGTSCLATCSAGSSGVVTGSIQCNDGEYIGTDFSGCQSDCETSFTQNNYAVTFCQAGSPHSTSCSAVCKSGYGGTVGGTVLCENGEWTGNFTGCQVCEDGFYKDVDSSGSCFPCPFGTTTPTTQPPSQVQDHDELQDCTVCVDGFSGTGPDLCYPDCDPIFTQSGYSINCSDGISYNSTCSAECSSGLGLTGVVEGWKQCGSNGLWEGPGFSGCGASCASAFLDSRYIITGCEAGSEHLTQCSAECFQGFSGNITGSVECQDGFWVGGFQGCGADCSQIYAQLGYEFSNCGFSGSSCTEVECGLGFQESPSGITGNIMCQSGSWVGDGFQGCLTVCSDDNSLQYQTNCSNPVEGDKCYPQCNVGYYGLATGSKTCSSSGVLVGTFSGCEFCQIGSYSDAVGMETCSSCPEYSTTLLLGSSSRSDCVCLADYFGDDGEECLPCPPGHVCSGGDSIQCDVRCKNCDEEQTLCEEPQDGFYVDGSGALVVCPAECPDSCTSSTCPFPFYIWIIIAASLLLICGLCILFYFIYYKPAQKKQQILVNNQMSMMSFNQSSNQLHSFASNFASNSMLGSVTTEAYGTNTTGMNGNETLVMGGEISLPGFLQLEMPDIRLGDKLGAGGMATVFSGTLLNEQFVKRNEGFEEVAVKVVEPNPRLSAEQNKDLFNQEVAILNTLSECDYVMKFIGFTNQPSAQIVTRLYHNDLGRYMVDQSKELPLLLVCKIAFDLSNAFNFMNQRSIVHRDVKPGNILLSLETFQGQTIPKPVLCDFGLARICDPNLMVFSQPINLNGLSPRHAAPEIYQRKTGQERDLLQEIHSDVYSFGVILWEMMHRSNAWEGVPIADIKGLVLSGERPAVTIDTTHPLAQMLLEMLEKCWQQEDSTRPDFRQIYAFLEKAFSMSK